MVRTVRSPDVEWNNKFLLASVDFIAEIMCHDRERLKRMTTSKEMPSWGGFTYVRHDRAARLQASFTEPDQQAGQLCL
jgi:hypothetical protein